MCQPLNYVAAVRNDHPPAEYRPCVSPGLASIFGIPKNATLLGRLHRCMSVAPWIISPLDVEPGQCEGLLEAGVALSRLAWS